MGIAHQGSGGWGEKGSIEDVERNESGWSSGGLACSTRHVPAVSGGPFLLAAVARISVYKILFHFKDLVWESVIILLPPPHMQSLPYCNTIALPSRNMCSPTDPPVLCHPPYTIGNGNIV